MASASLWVGGESARTLPTLASLWPLQGLWLALHRVAKSITSSPFISMIFQEGLRLLQGHTGEGVRLHPSALGWTFPPSAACKAPAFQVIPGTQETGVVPLPGPGRSLGENEGRASTPVAPRRGDPSSSTLYPKPWSPTDPLALELR